MIYFSRPFFLYSRRQHKNYKNLCISLSELVIEVITFISGCIYTYIQT